MYFKLLEMFLLRIFFNKDEYNITSKNFNLIKIVFVLIATCSFVLNGFFIYKLNRIHERISVQCPQMLLTETPASTKKK